MNKCTGTFNKDAEIHNIKSISRMNSFIKRLIFSFSSLYKTFLSMHEELLKIKNDLNFRSVDKQMIDSYNKMILFMYEQVSEILSQTISGQRCTETLIVKPVNEDRNQYSHKLELVYFLENMSCVTKQLGIITNVSIGKIEDHITLLRGETTHEFILIDIDSEISVSEFRSYLEIYDLKIKDLIGWFYNDIDYVKIAFRSLLDIFSDAMKLSSSSSEQKKWKVLIKRIKLNSTSLKHCIDC